jgi:hypothetical protein
MAKKKETDFNSILNINAVGQRDIAKAGMVSSLGTLFLTGFFKFKGARSLHTWAGWALLGFSIWHHVLSTPKSKVVSEDR